jgi:hypothetical protein
MTWFVKAIHGHVSLFEGTKHLPEGKVLCFSNEERSHDDSKQFEKLGYIKFFKSREEAESYKYTPVAELPILDKPLYQKVAEGIRPEVQKVIAVTKQEEPTAPKNESVVPPASESIPPVIPPTTTEEEKKPEAEEKKPEAEGVKTETSETSTEHEVKNNENVEDQQTEVTGDEEAGDENTPDPITAQTEAKTEVKPKITPVRKQPR